MNTELALIEDPEARRAQIDRTDVLDQIKAIAQLPADAVVSDSYAAQIYGVPTNTVVQLRTRRLREWVEADALGFDDILSSNAGKGRTPSQGHNRRGLLLLGMMVRDSEVASVDAQLVPLSTPQVRPGFSFLCTP